MGAHKTAVYPTHDTLLSPSQVYALMALGGEAGELLNLTKKALRGDFSDNPIDNEEFQERLVKELGGILWYLAETATVFDLNLDWIAEQNIKLLADRAKRNVIKGSGDDR